MVKMVQNLDSKVICKVGITVPLPKVVVIIDYANIWKGLGGISGGYFVFKKNILVIIITAKTVT